MSPALPDTIVITQTGTGASSTIKLPPSTNVEQIAVSNAKLAALTVEGDILMYDQSAQLWLHLTASASGPDADSVIPRRSRSLRAGLPDDGFVGMYRGLVARRSDLDLKHLRLQPNPREWGV